MTPGETLSRLLDRTSTLRSYCTLLLSLFALSAVVASSAPAGAQASELPTSRPVEEIRLLMKGVGRVAWSAQGDRLAYDKLGPEGRYHLYTADPRTLIERCLTCEPYELKKKNSLNPTWHPSGEFLVFQVQSNSKKLKLTPVELATAERGLYSELYAIRTDGKDFWQLTRGAEDGAAIIDPHFSHEGTRLLWGERVRSRVGRWGTWEIKVGEVRTRRGIMRLSSVSSYEPGPQKLFLAPSAFTPDDKGALFAGNREPGQNENGMDVYRFQFEGGRVERLTHTRRAWDEQARYSPRGDKIVWSAAAEIRLRRSDETDGLPPEQLRDLWIMNEDGSEKERLTYFNHPNSAESIGNAIVDNFTWNPAGDEIIAHVIWGSRGRIEQGIYLVKLAESFRR
jgi:Tol biopolymer transport system component